MKKRETILIIVFLLAGTALSFAQDELFLRQIDPFPLIDLDGTTYSLPLLGGMNRPVPQLVDIDADGDLDLFLRDGGKRIMFLRNDGTPSADSFTWVTDSFEGLDVGGWFRFADADGDGDLDLFSDNSFAYIRYFRNEGSPTVPAFVLAADTLRDNLNQEILVDNPTIPAWVDLDCDGDLDLFLGRISGEVTQYDNIGNGPDDIPQFVHITDSFQGLLILTGPDNCTMPLVNRGENPHGANAMEFVDIDADGDDDLFWGDFFAQSLLYLENSGTCLSPVITLTETQYPPEGPVCTGGFNIPAFGDIDDDGDQDLLVGVQGGAFSLTINLADNFYLYRNTGDSSQSLFQLETKRFLPTFDVGSHSLPGLVDIDGDGDLDVFIGNEAEADHDNSSRLHFLTNEGTATSPILHHTDGHYLSLEIGYYYAPSFSDIDNDGDQDMILGEWDGNLNLLRNDGTPYSPLFVLTDEDYGAIDVGNNSTPALVDIDNDGDFDLFIGEFLGNINFYRNNGSREVPSFVLETTDYFSINVSAYSAPAFTDIDEDGDFDLFVGSDTSGTKFYRNVGTAADAFFVPDTTISIPFHQRTSPAFGDLDSDGDPDLLMGIDRGGMVFYKNQQELLSVAAGGQDDGVARTFGLVRNYPNPFNPRTILRFDLLRPADVTITIYDPLGRETALLARGHYGTGTHLVSWDAGDFSSGVYLARIDAGISVRFLKLLLLK